MNNFKKILTVGSVSTALAVALAVPVSAAITRPNAAASHSVVVSHAVKTKKVAFRGSYRGTIALLMVGPTGQAATTVKVTSLRGRGTGTYVGAGAISATGSAAASNQCDELSGLGSITGAGSKLIFKVVTSASSQGCAAGTSTPTSVSVKGVAQVTGGSGKYKGVSGTLSFKGSFNVTSNTAGSSESDAFSATLTGTLAIKS